MRNGSIPAGAGNPSRISRRDLSARVHPRGCGESGDTNTFTDHDRGPSPRVRGIPRSGRSERSGIGSIPAGAGNPRGTLPGRVRMRVHPRGCGESGDYNPQMKMSQGPSPRVRGIPQRVPDLLLGPGSIPAGAGNPVRAALVMQLEWVHPRGCGESQRLVRPNGPARGPSPRVRGIPCSGMRRPGMIGSIPAGAGNPRRGGGPPPRPRVHPRGCGESSDSRIDSSPPRGPSPRVRGIPPTRPRAAGSPGSIPAGAGNP